MTYFNPRINNYHNLKKRDKNVVDGMVYLIDSLENIEADYVSYEDETTLGKIRNEIAIETLKEAQERLKLDIVEFMVSMIETKAQLCPLNHIIIGLLSKMCCRLKTSNLCFSVSL